MLHRTAKLTPFGRRLLVERILVEGWSPAIAAETLGVSRATAYKWVHRYRDAEHARDLVPSASDTAGGMGCSRGRRELPRGVQRFRAGHVHRGPVARESGCQ